MVIFIAFAICQLFCVLIPFFKENEENQRNKIADRLSIIFAIIAFGISIYMYLDADDKENLREITLNKKLAERDSLHEIKDSILTIYYMRQIDSSYGKSIKASNEAIAKYNLVLIDSMNNVSNKINIKSAIEPEILLDAINKSGPPIYYSVRDEKRFLNFRFVSKNNVSYNSSIEYFVLENEDFDDGSSAALLIDSQILFTSRRIFINGIETIISVPFKPEWNNLKNGIIMLRGKFSVDIESKKVKKYFQVVKYDFTTNTFLGELPGFPEQPLK